MAFQGLEDENVSLEIGRLDRVLRSEDAAELQVAAMDNVAKQPFPLSCWPTGCFAGRPDSCPSLANHHDTYYYSLHCPYWLQISRVVEASVADLEGMENVKHWLGIIGEGCLPQLQLNGMHCRAGRVFHCYDATDCEMRHVCIRLLLRCFERSQQRMDSIRLCWSLTVK